MITGSDIREARNRAGMSQEALATAVGVTLRTIGNWERSVTVPRSKEPILRTILGDHLNVGEVSSPRLRSSSDEELISEIARRLARARQEEGKGDVATPAQKTRGERVKITPAVGKDVPATRKEREERHR